MKITAIAGGVGGAKLVEGLAQVLLPENLCVIVNTGDDFDHLGLYISPDLDTVCYTLAGLSNDMTGWGRTDESWNVLTEIKRLNGPGWFNIGDKDIATHLERTRRLKLGDNLSEITQSFCGSWGVSASVYPMSDKPIHTMINTLEYGWIPFQEYFVKYQCLPKMLSLRFDGVEGAVLPEKAKENLLTSDWVVICPSNPFVSIEPILKIKDVEAILEKKKVLAVSPIINGNALKGPAAKMFLEMGITPSAFEVLKRYNNFVDVFVVERGDGADVKSKNQWDIMIVEADTIMRNKEDKKHLAEKILEVMGFFNGGR